MVLKEDKARIFLNNDNDDGREVVDFCIKQRKTIVNPIIDWEDDDVWEFIREYNIPYCSLYDEGYKRLGCIGCPMGRSKQMKEQFERWPTYKRMYLKSFEKMLEKKESARKNWKTSQDVFDWWIGEKKDE